MKISNKTISVILFAILLAVLLIFFKGKITQQKAAVPPTKITKEFLSRKEFIADRKQIMGSKHFKFTSTNKVSYYINDKTAYGYNGTYTFEYDNKGNQFIKIVEENSKLMVLLLVKSPRELEIKKVTPIIYKPMTVNSFDIKHKIGKIYELKIIKTE